MQMKTFILGNLQTNCYLLWHDLSGEAIIIDPADDGDFLNEELLQNHLTLKAVVLTHGHFDHCLGLLSLQSAWQMPIMMNFADQFLLAQAQKSAKHWLGLETDPVPPANTNLENQTQLNLIGENFTIIPTPGHTPGSICLLHKKSKILLSGDTIFAEGNLGRTDFAYSSQAKMQESLAKLKRLAQVGNYIEVFPGHGKSFLI
jgi:glyoxylase-like metal-dependent hydrolase (beta-lactamase superfamily II)